MIDNREFYEQSYFDELIENSIWRYLVNGVFQDLFTPEYCFSNNLSCEWQKMHLQLTTSYVEEIESKFYPIEFVITRNGKREGYRYTNCYMPDQERYCNFLKSRNIDVLFVIDFSSEIQSAFLHPLIVPPGLDDIIKSITLKEFFSGFFSDAEYDEYVQGARKAVEDAYKYVGKRTVTNLTYQSLPFFLQSALHEITDFPYSTTVYVPNAGLKKPALSWYGSGVLSKGDKKIIRENFHKLERYYALIGNKDFAKSFITSEYLYQTLKDNNRFDFTAIVTGYFKSIEQFLFLMLGIVENDGHLVDVWIQSKIPYHKVYQRLRSEFRPNPTDINRTQVRIKPGNGGFYDTSFAALVYMLQDYGSGWAVSAQAKDFISALLLTYSDECRNEHLHKDNIYNITEVEAIRDKTYLLLYYVLGGYDYSKNGQSEKALLGIVDNSFENLYRRIMECGPGNYYNLSFSSGSAMLVALPMQQEPPEYDINGLMVNPALRFVRIPRKSIDDWHKDDWGEIETEFSDAKTITVRRDHMPIAVEYIDKMTGETKTIKW